MPRQVIWIKEAKKKFFLDILLPRGFSKVCPKGLNPFILQATIFGESVEPSFTDTVTNCVHYLLRHQHCTDCRMSMLVSDKHSCKWSPFLRRTDRKIMLVACHKLLRHETFAWVFDIFGDFPTLWCINFWAKNSPLFIFCIGKMSMVIHLPLLSWTPENGISVHLASRIEKSRKFN